MRKLPFAILGLLLLTVIPACSLDNDNDTDTDEQWQKANAEWWLEMNDLTNPDGTPYFTKIEPAWCPSSMVLMHWYNDRSLTAGNLVPLSTSTVAIKYRLSLYNGTAVDSSYTQVDSIATMKVSSVINGFQIALQSMHVGDSVRVIIPYSEGYGAVRNGKIRPYSTLDFTIKLTDIPYYEIPDR